MKKTMFLSVVVCVCSLLHGCSKTEAEIPTTNPSTTPSGLVTDPTNWNPSVVQTNTNAKQYNYGKVKVIASLSVVLTAMGITEVSNNSLHVYLKTAAGAYIHLPMASTGGITYSYYLKSVNPSSALHITRTLGLPEVYDDIIILSAKTSYLQSLSSPINFSVYANAKAKLGF